MVEFGLKLEDNKVAEWSEYYLDYNKLKAILKKAKECQTKYEEQAQKRPQASKDIMEAHQAGKEELITVTPNQSAVNLATAAAETAISADPILSKLQPALLEEPSERTSLLPDSGQHEQHPDSKIPNRMPSFSHRAISDIQEYFGSRYERNLRNLLRESDSLSEEFAENIAKEQKKVTAFYYDKLGELENRLSLLTDSVATSTVFKIARAHSKTDEEESTKENIVMGPILGTHRRAASEMTPRQRVDSIINKLQNKMHDAHILERLRGDNFEATRLPGAGGFRTGLDPDDEDDNFDDEKALAEADSIKRALIDQYRTAKLLHNFAILNYTGFVKIIKKHDKSVPAHKNRFKGILKAENLFNEGQAVDKLAKEYEAYYAAWFCDGDIRAAHAQMLPKRGDGLEMDWSQLRLGYRMGMCAVLALWVCWDSVWGLVAEGNTTIGGRSAFPVFRACGGILLLQWCWGCSVFVWTRYRINYIYLFDFNPRIVATPLGIFEEAVDNTLVFNVLMLLYYKAGAEDIPAIIPSGGFPFFLVLYTIYRLIFPLRSRMPLWEAIGKVITAPLHSPSFFHGYVGDIFTSMVKVFQDMAWTACWLFSGDFLENEDLRHPSKFHWSKSYWYNNFLIPLLCLLPLLIRFNQCLRRYMDTGDRMPHLANAGKYALSQTVTLFGAFHPLYMTYSSEFSNGAHLFQLFWMVVFISSSLYSFGWDVYMDWGLGRPEHNFLGSSLMYPRRYYYYSVMAIDIVLRFMWVLTLVPPSSGAAFEVPSYLTAVTMMLELFRRTIWGFFRLENEHRSNAAGFRRVGFVPLHFHTGHDHGYKDKKSKSGLSVLREVILIALGVGGVCVWSVVSAQKANRSFADAMKEL